MPCVYTRIGQSRANPPCTRRCDEPKHRAQRHGLLTFLNPNLNPDETLKNDLQAEVTLKAPGEPREPEENHGQPFRLLATPHYSQRGTTSMPPEASSSASLGTHKNDCKYGAKFLELHRVSPEHFQPTS